MRTTTAQIEAVAREVCAALQDADIALREAMPVFYPGAGSVEVRGEPWGDERLQNGAST
ncbi:MAG: hypothetical protein Q8Q14_03055 [Gemmatimonadales bacterium]|nr:hypothetical protein [Gemmatimonadales bacterium]